MTRASNTPGRRAILPCRISRLAMVPVNIMVFKPSKYRVVMSVVRSLATSSARARSWINTNPVTVTMTSRKMTPTTRLILVGMDIPLSVVDVSSMLAFIVSLQSISVILLFSSHKPLARHEQNHAVNRALGLDRAPSPSTAFDVETLTAVRAWQTRWQKTRRGLSARSISPYISRSWAAASGFLPACLPGSDCR